MLFVATQRNAPTCSAPTPFTVSVVTPVAGSVAMAYLSPGSTAVNSCSLTPLCCQAYEIAPPSPTPAYAVNVASLPASTCTDFGTCENTGASMVGVGSVVTSGAATKSLVTPCANAATLTR